MSNYLFQDWKKVINLSPELQEMITIYHENDEIIRAKLLEPWDEIIYPNYIARWLGISEYFLKKLTKSGIGPRGFSKGCLKNVYNPEDVIIWCIENGFGVENKTIPNLTNSNPEISNKG